MGFTMIYPQPRILSGIDFKIWTGNRTLWVDQHWNVATLPLSWMVWRPRTVSWFPCVSLIHLWRPWSSPRPLGLRRRYGLVWYGKGNPTFGSAGRMYHAPCEWLILVALRNWSILIDSPHLELESRNTHNGRISKTLFRHPDPLKTTVTTLVHISQEWMGLLYWTFNIPVTLTLGALVPMCQAELLTILRH